MKNTLLKTILVEVVKKFLPLILNAVCASICVYTAGCTLTAKDLNLTVTNPITQGE